MPDLLYVTIRMSPPRINDDTSKTLHGFLYHLSLLTIVISLYEVACGYTNMNHCVSIPGIVTHASIMNVARILPKKCPTYNLYILAIVPVRCTLLNSNGNIKNVHKICEIIIDLFISRDIYQKKYFKN